MYSIIDSSEIRDKYTMYEYPTLKRYNTETKYI